MRNPYTKEEREKMVHCLALKPFLQKQREVAASDILMDAVFLYLKAAPEPLVIDNYFYVTLVGCEKPFNDQDSDFEKRLKEDERYSNARKLYDVFILKCGGKNSEHLSEKVNEAVGEALIKFNRAKSEYINKYDGVGEQRWKSEFKGRKQEKMFSNILDGKKKNIAEKVTDRILNKTCSIVDRMKDWKKEKKGDII